MAWGIKRADEMGLESYIDATESGTALYEKYGYIKAPGVDFVADKHDPSPYLKQLQQELLPFTFWPMWRPAGGKLSAGSETQWEHAA